MEAYCVRAYAEALEVVPYTLAENAGLPPIEIVSELRQLHADGQHPYHGINVKKGAITDMREERVVQPLLVTSSALALATECVRMILKVWGGAARARACVYEGGGGLWSLWHFERGAEGC
jgi:T-complex protein 1 subunit delta